MENLTHSLVGAAIAELAIPPGVTSAQRKLFYTVGIVAANLPDADLIYTRIMPDPLGYLLHHRGHTHTVVGLIGLALLIALVTRIPRWWPSVQSAPNRFWMLVGGALASHIILDSWNSYGVHPFWPIDTSWYYADAVSIFEPWLWVILGVSVGLNTHNKNGRIALLALPMALVFLAIVLHVIPMAPGSVLLILAVVLLFALLRVKSQSRAVIAMTLTVLFVLVNAGFTHVAHSRAAASLRSGEQQLVDVALTSAPAQPLCRVALSVEKNEGSGTFTLRRGSVSLAPSSLSWLGCDQPGVVWGGGSTQSLTELRQLYARDCYVRQWMEFARAPSMYNGALTDARFGESGRAGFTSLAPSAERRDCARFDPHWRAPREDLLGRN